ncbi:MAG: 4'-phosphopantetheinyl transferase superfamily protein [Bacteroidales bacterium]|nr:4'-phosphopantetheinyl transferase superfamily protein [Bacteroidales bacterium]
MAIDDKEIGVDIEEISRYKESLESYVLNEDEVPRCARNDKSRAECFIEIWTQKEAVFKLLGTGITHDIKNVLKDNPDVNVYSQKIGDKILSVATRKIL